MIPEGIMKGVLKIILLLVCAAVAISAGGLWGIYFHELKALPSDASPCREKVPEVVLKGLWISESQSTLMRMEPVSPWNWVLMFACHDKGAYPPSFVVASQAARALLARNGPSSHRSHALEALEWIAASIWVSRNWNAEEALTTILHESYFGHDFKGIQQASQGYFGLAVDNLSISEGALLAGLVRQPQTNDPWCHARHANAFAKDLMTKIDPMATFSPRLLPAPEDACGKTKDAGINERQNAAARI
jgi:hypothetical protein